MKPIKRLKALIFTDLGREVKWGFGDHFVVEDLSFHESGDLIKVQLVFGIEEIPIGRYSPEICIEIIKGRIYERKTM